MAEIPRAWVDGFADSLEMVSDEMRGRLAESLAQVDFTMPVAYVRERLVAIMQVYCYESRSLAAQVAAEFYDGMRERLVGERMGAVGYDGYEPEAVERRVRSAVEPLAKAQRAAESVDEEAIAHAAEKVGGALVDYQGWALKAAAGNTIYRNGAKDARKPQFARVPRGSKSYPGGCPFCQMLASRGFAYRSKLTAGGLDPDHYHSDCQCMVVPRWGSGGIEGYDPSVYEAGYQEWLKADHGTHEAHVELTQRNRYTADGRLKSGDGNRVDEKGAGSYEELRRLRSKRAAGDKSRMFHGLGVTENEWKAMSEAQQQELLDARRGARDAGLESVGAMRYRERRSSNVILTDKRFGKKVTKHCKDWELDPSSAEDRDRLLGIIEAIIDNADEVVVGTTWQDQPQPCTFLRKGEDLVIVNGHDEFVTIMRNGSRNRRFLRAREEARSG